MGACFSKAGTKGPSSQEQAQPVQAVPVAPTNGVVQPLTPIENPTLEQEKSVRTTPTDQSETTTATTSGELAKRDLATNGRDTKVLVQGEDITSTNSILDSNDGDEFVERGSPSRSRRRMPRASSAGKAALPSIFSNASGPPEAPEDQANRWGENLSLTEWDDSLVYRPAVIGDAAAERARVSALKRLGIDYTSKEQALDFITKLITNVCACSAATICLIDSSMCYIKSTSGGPSNVTKVDRRLSISMYCLVPLKPEVLVVEDLTADARFKDHPFVKGPPFIKFFAAAPLLDASGSRIGTIAIHDFKPRPFDADSCNILCNFAEMTMRELQRISESTGFQRAMSWTPSPGNEQLLRKIDACSDGVALMDVRVGRWPILFSNEGWSDVTGLPPVSGSVKNFWDMFQLPGVSASRQPWAVYETSVERGETFTLDVILAGSSGKQLFAVTFKPATEDLDEGMVSINVPSRVASSQLGPHDQNFYFGTIFRGRHGSLSRSASQSLPPPTPTATPEDELKPPIPNVRLGPLLGKGSFGSVHYGTWNGAQIAVKVIQHMATEAERQARDEQLEAILGLKMLHPNIVRTFQFATKDRSGSRPGGMTERLRMDLNSLAEEEDSPKGQRKMMETWIILELCNRGSLQEAIDKGAFRIRSGEVNEGSPNMINILRTATEIAGAMSYLHSLDILHSDLNGNNILLISNTGIDDRPFSVKVSDFGLSRIHIGERTVATQTYGTVTHMPPELLAEGRLSKAADVYAFGVLLWEMLTGQRPWAGLRHVQIITRKMHAGTQLKWPNNVFKPFRDLAQQCMHPDSHQRPTFSQVLELLEPMRECAERGDLEEYYREPEKADGMSATLGNISKIEEGEETGYHSSKGQGE